VCVIKLIGWKMDGWIGLSGCGKWMDVESGKWRGSGSHICKKSKNLFRPQILSTIDFFPPTELVSRIL